MTPTAVRTPEAVAEAYFANWIGGDFDALGEVIADDVDFVGSMGKAQGRQAALGGLTGVRGMVEDIRVIQRWVNGDDVITWFEFDLAGKEPIPVVNWSHVTNGQIDRIRVTFDPRPLLG